MKLNELKAKHKTLKAENIQKSGDLETLQCEMEELRSDMLTVEKRASDMETERDMWRKVTDKYKYHQNCNNVEDYVDSMKHDSGSTLEDIHVKEVIYKMEQQNLIIEKLTKNTVYYSNQVATLEDQIDDLKSTIAQKDEQIMKIRHSAGKLQTYITAGKTERERTIAGFRHELNKNHKETEERFGRIEDKIDVVIRMMNINRNGTKPGYTNTENQFKSQKNIKQNKFNKKSGR